MAKNHHQGQTFAAVCDDPELTIEFPFRGVDVGLK